MVILVIMLAVVIAVMGWKILHLLYRNELLQLENGLLQCRNEDLQEQLDEVFKERHQSKKQEKQQLND